MVGSLSEAFTFGRMADLLFGQLTLLSMHKIIEIDTSKTSMFEFDMCILFEY